MRARARARAHHTAFPSHACSQRAWAAGSKSAGPWGWESPVTLCASSAAPPPRVRTLPGTRLSGARAPTRVHGRPTRVSRRPGSSTCRSHQRGRVSRVPRYPRGLEAGRHQVLARGPLPALHGCGMPSSGMRRQRTPAPLASAARPRASAHILLGVGNTPFRILLRARA